jgi:hypothetical protein
MPSRSWWKGTSGRIPAARPVPGRLVPKLSGELGPGGIGDGSGKALADQVGDRKVFDGQRAVGLGELARDLVKEGSADVGDVIVLSGQ